MPDDDFLVTPQFLAVYESLDDETAVAVDEVIRRLVDDPGTAWARRNRVSGDEGGAWLVEMSSGTTELALYWDLSDDRRLLLLLLVVR